MCQVRDDLRLFFVSLVSPIAHAILFRQRIRLTRGGNLLPSPKTGNAYSWKTIQPQSNLHEGRQPVVMGDEHHARQPSFPYEPTLRALLALQNEHETPVNMRTVEIFTDAEVLAQLFTLISDPARTRPFRLELSTVRNTLFIEKGRHHGEGHTEKGGPIKRAMPVWTTNALRRVGFEEPRLPFSGGHYRVVRYRMGNLVCAVRGKIDFVYENRKTPSQATFDPLRGVHPTAIVENITTPLDREENGNGNTTAQDDDQKEHVIQTWRTAVKHLGMGTKPDRTGKLSLRFAWESDAACLTRLMRTELPLLWFARTTYLVDALVTQNLTVVESKLRAVRGTSYHRAWERAHQTDLRLLAAILHKMKRVTRGVGGTCILVCDPVQRCFMVMKPVVKKWPIPEEVAVQLWGPEDDPAETEYESTAESKSSGLSTLRSRTPSGFTDWTLDEEIKKAGRMMGTDDQGRGRRDVTSRALVSQWLGGYHPDDLDDKMDIDVDEASSDELAPNDSQSRCGEASSFSEEDNDLVRYGVDGSMDVDEVDDEYTYAYADDEAEDGYESFDEEQDDEYDEDESGGESNNQYEHGHDDHQEDECDLETEQGDVRLHFGAKNNVISDEPEPNRSNGKPTPTESLRVYGQRYMC